MKRDSGELSQFLPLCRGGGGGAMVFYYAPTPEKLRGHIGLGLSVRPRVCLSVTLGS